MEIVVGPITRISRVSGTSITIGRRYPTDTSDAFAMAADVLFSNLDWW
jgi:hypothetical protein